MLFSIKISDSFFIISLSSLIVGNNFLILDTSIDALKVFPSAPDDEYDKYILSLAAVNALYILKLSSYNLSIVPLASSIPFSLKIALSLSLKYPSFLLTLGNIPSFKPIIKTVLIL